MQIEHWPAEVEIAKLLFPAGRLDRYLTFKEVGLEVGGKRIDT